ncbi:MAG: hypothetical protein A3C85_03850 [Candidatus Doudnabacteria bacterium RIFCSPHIGHO2_02_FULL_48_21]|uniref:Glycosyl transferase family 1 domain-containing protein n=1 Tax=Candidatus Doudnabacteria bacterium RIFCSPLOWO2_02_FULL_48_13 TaxID=1817845 RepID=A0A1F5QBZ6_9BACT|nr:MAG: hypothetical protein A3K05_03345 [Candidatus Doudnabacteria bacterium RIFCSPHIGHO2_01_48_18]OGE77171.1 MAG: hypothetical protein A2668_01665 [Candidatus Doudnabacteria bacterium RIFCSPHIGHO2_01_FULL_48_180]OGE91776.1 MAG: hypothetical protein A3F44_00190 [Candidatus Doudnabacteria bacterium RIFCSPHIGHO2_12_FULL_47_25]OGE93589.1 MAG: hypothetical protein A3C85_03850 [Candidatus Doudnabacteria bacterium RIFCSPHIGHO2_02_FULL_48_21]OGE96513.1 MAG: hypothetical protein A3A83_04270 [Candidatu
MKKRILIFSIAYEPLVGGAELAVRNITDRLSNFEFDLITCHFDKGYPDQEKIGNVNVYRVGFGNRIGRILYPLFAAHLARKLHRKNPYNLVWSIMAAYAGAAALLFLRGKPNLNFLLTLQEGDPIQHIHGRVRGFRKIWQRIFKRADYIQAISRFLADWARQEGSVCPIEVVPNGVDFKKFQIPSFRLKDGQEFIIVTASRLVPKNGVDILIRAVVKLQTTNYKLQILGVGPEEVKLKALAKKLGVSQRVHFLGNILQDEIPQYLSEADIFVRPSRSEGLGTAFLEAMAAGVPIIGTPVGGIPDFLTEGETGLFSKTDDPADLADKITILAEKPELRRKLSQNGKQLVMEKYSWGLVAEKMDKILRVL